jgi:hypothetical protein
MNTITFGTNTFCGPSVISAITGLSTDKAAETISRITGRKKVVGVYSHELEKAFHLLDYKTERIPVSSRSVFGMLYVLKRDGTYVFMVPGHFIAIEINGNDKFICDNHTRTPINISASARLNQKVIGLFRVWK